MDQKTAKFSFFISAAILSSSLFAATATVDLGSDHQRISGFGVSTAWASSMSTTDAALLWDTTSGAGLSLHRIRIGPDGTTSETSIAKQAVSYGVKVWASPWSSNYTVVYGTDASGNSMKHLNFSQAQSWANTILSFVHTMKSAGVPIYAVSSQNEPDGTGDNHYSADSLALWIGYYLGPTLDTTGVKVMGPETMNWYGFPSYKTSIFNNTNAKKYTSIIATHEYGGSAAAYPEIAEAGKEFWETEVYDLGSTVEDTGMTSALRVANVMHTALTVSNVNAWHFWWVYPCSAASCGNGALWSQGSNSHATKRLWIMGNYSRFIRPGFVRIDATTNPTSNVTMTAYRDSLSKKIVVVANNSNTSATNIDFSFGNTTVTDVTPYITDSTRNIASQGSATIGSNTYTYSLPARSVTTLVFALQTETIVDQAPYADTIPIPGTLEAENYDVGGQGVSYSDNETANQGCAYRTNGVDIVSITGGGYAVGYTVAGEWLEYTVNVADPGIYSYTARIAAGGDGSSFRLFLDDVAISDTVKVSSTGSDWETYADLSGTTVSLSAGAHVLKIEITGSYVNIDNFVFTKGTTLISKSASNLMRNSQTYKVYNANGSYIGSFNAVDIPALKTEIRKSNWKSGIYLVKNKNTSAFIGIEK